MRRMSVQEYKRWLRQPESREASLPNFFPSGVKRTINVLQGDANQSSINKWNSFKARHVTAYNQNPTSRRRFTIKNWGIQQPKAKNEKKTH